MKHWHQNCNEYDLLQFFKASKLGNLWGTLYSCIIVLYREIIILITLCVRVEFWRMYNRIRSYASRFVRTRCKSIVIRTSSGFRGVSNTNRCCLGYSYGHGGKLKRRRSPSFARRYDIVTCVTFSLGVYWSCPWQLQSHLLNQIC